MDHTTVEETASTTRAAWGEGRIAFAANAEQIRERMNSGWPLKKIYRELESALGGLSYQQFAYHIRRQKPKTTAQTGSSSPSPATVETPVPPSLERGLHEKPKAPGQTTRFKPGPRIPDPTQLY